MKLTENDIKYVINKAVALIKEGRLDGEGETSGFRGVRQIILSNILAKHPGFHWRNEVAWAYYVMRHQMTREKQRSEVPAELMQKVNEGLEEDKTIKANIEAELKAKQNAYKAWVSNPENYKDVVFDFDLADLTNADEQTIQDELKRFNDYSEDNYKKASAFKQDVTLTRGSDGKEFNTSFRAPIDNTKRNEIRKKLIDALAFVQKESGLKNFPERLYYSPNSNVEPSAEWRKRYDMAKQERESGSYVVWVDFNSDYQNMRGFHCGFCPKYNIIEEVDSSD